MKTKKKFYFSEGQLVFNEQYRNFGTVLNNFKNPLEGDGGELRLDSDGMQCIFLYDKEWKHIGYKLIPVPQLQLKVRKPKGTFYCDWVEKDNKLVAIFEHDDRKTTKVVCDMLFDVEFGGMRETKEYVFFTFKKKEVKESVTLTK